LQQYAGRLHREHATKTQVRILDFIDAWHSALLRMWDKRQRGYRAMGYRITGEGTADLSTPRRKSPVTMCTAANSSSNTATSVFMACSINERAARRNTPSIPKA